MKFHGIFIHKPTIFYSISIMVSSLNAKHMFRKTEALPLFADYEQTILSKRFFERVILRLFENFEQITWNIKFFNDHPTAFS